MRSALLPDDLWTTIQPLLPPEPPKPKGGRPRASDRAALTGILFVLKTGCPWQALPKELGCGSGSTCWRRLRDWQAAGVWAEVHAELLARMRGADLIDWSRAAVDSCAVRAKRGVAAPGRARWTAARRGSSGTSSSMARARRSA